MTREKLLAAEYERGLAKMMASGYEEFAETIENHKLVIAALRGVAQTVPMLWCCHVRGPDDVYAAPDYMTALAWSDAMNELNWKANSKLNIGDPTSFRDCLIKAVPAPWPHSPEAHATNLPESIKGFSDPCSVTSTEHCAKCGCETKGEAALVDGEIWCHPCADVCAVTSTTWCGYCVNTGFVGRRYGPDWKLVDEPCPKCTVVPSNQHREVGK